ncbi:MAG: GNAT family N-acetyltransferase [Chitinophagales bacterium]|nr:GNAT family N-acetyltransferase [Chitinophagales bacterium]
MEIHFASTDEQLLKCRKAILELRPHISITDYLEKATLLLSEGAKMIYVDNGEPDAPAVSVFRVNYYFYRGKNLYIDDLSTMAAERGKGYAGALIDFIIDYAREQGCDNIHLDSGYGSDRFTAHRLYLNKGFYLSSHHFTLDLKGT